MTIAFILKRMKARAHHFLIALLFVLTMIGYAQTWEYARLTVTTIAGKLVASWTSPTEKEFAEGGLLPLAERVMGHLVPDEKDTYIVFLNFLGEQGWELVWVDRRETWTDYLFKRAKP